MTDWFKKYVMLVLIIILFVMAGSLLLVGFFTEDDMAFVWFLGTENKKETIEFIALGIGGVIAAIVAVAIYRRAEAQAKTAEAQAQTAVAQAESAKAQAESAEAQVKTAEAQMKTVAAQVKNNELIEQGHVDERFRSAIKNLGHEAASVRIASFHQFCYLAKNYNDVEFSNNIFDILCAHLRNMTRDKIYQTSIGEKRPSEESQTLLDILFKSRALLFEEFKADIRSVHFVGANLYEADLSGASLWNANLSNAHLVRANFLKTNLSYAKLLSANLIYAELSDANLLSAKLSDADIRYANFSDARLLNADLSGADLRHANLSGADLKRTNLSGANLRDTQLENANLMEVLSIENADFRGAKIGDKSITRHDIPTEKGKYYDDWSLPPQKEEG